MPANGDCISPGGAAALALLALALSCSVSAGWAGTGSQAFRVTMTPVSASPPSGGAGGGGSVICRADPVTGLVDCAGGIPPVTPVPPVGGGGTVPVVPPVVVAPPVIDPPVVVIPPPGPIVVDPPVAGGGGSLPVVEAPYWEWRPMLYPGSFLMAGLNAAPAGALGQVTFSGNALRSYLLGYRYDSVLGASSETRLITDGGQGYLEMMVGW